MIMSPAVRSLKKRKRSRSRTQTEPGLQVSDLMLVQSPVAGTTPVLFVPTNRNESSLFGESGGVLAEIYQPNGKDTLAVHWKLHGVLDGFGERIERFADSVSTASNGLLHVTPQQEGISVRLETCKRIVEDHFHSIAAAEARTRRVYARDCVPERFLEEATTISIPCFLAGPPLLSF